MPVLGTMLVSLFTSLTAFLTRWLVVSAAARVASYTLYLGVLATFVASVYVCIGGLLSYLQGAAGGVGGISWLSYFWMGLGMFIPANATAVLSCLGSVWLGCQVYRLRAIGLMHFTR